MSFSFGIKNIYFGFADEQFLISAFNTPVSYTHLDQVVAEVLPGDKADVVSRLQREGKTVMMVGDGINDAPALVQADVGCAVGSGSDIALESGDIVLMKSDLMDVYRAIRLSKATIRNIQMCIRDRGYPDCHCDGASDLGDPQ